MTTTTPKTKMPKTPSLSARTARPSPSAATAGHHGQRQKQYQIRRDDGRDSEASLTIRDLTLNIDAPVKRHQRRAAFERSRAAADHRRFAADDAIHCDELLNIGTRTALGQPHIDITGVLRGLEAQS